MARYWDKSQLDRVWRNRQRKVSTHPLKEGVQFFLKKVVYPRHKKMSAVARAWTELLPAELREHSWLAGVQKGQLRVLVDSAPHLYELNLLVKGGLLNQLRDLCPNVSLSAIRLERGVWYRVDADGNKIIDL